MQLHATRLVHGIMLADSVSAQNKAKVAVKVKNPVKKLSCTVPDGSLLQLAAMECKDQMAEL